MAVTGVLGACSLGQAAAAGSASTGNPKGAASAPRTQPAKVVLAPDLCRGAIDPYNPGRQRAKFFRAARVDGELDAKEFIADARRLSGYVRRFDNWQVMLEYDGNANGTVDWFESERYRLTFRRKVLGIFDLNKDGKLKGAERDAANQALAAGKLTPTSRKDLERVKGYDELLTKEMVAQYDINGDGKLSQEERQEAIRAWREQWWKGVLQKYDTDRDGQLSKQERQAASRAIAEQISRKKRKEAAAIAVVRDPAEVWRQARRRWELRLFDTDSNGELNDAEQTAAGSFGRKVNSIVQTLSERSMDANRDGSVSDAERAAFLRAWQSAAGDQRAEPSERVTLGVFRWAESIAASFDTDRDGRFSSGEIAALLAGMDKELTMRYRAHDADRDGRLAAREMMELMESFAQED